MVTKSERFLTWISSKERGWPGWGGGMPLPITQPHDGTRVHSSLCTGFHSNPADGNLFQVYLINIHEEMRMYLNFHQGPDLCQLFIMYGPQKSLPSIKA